MERVAPAVLVRFLLALFAGGLLFTISWADSFLERSGHTLYILPVFTISFFLIWEWCSFVSSKLDSTRPWRSAFYSRVRWQLFYTALLIFPLFNGLYLGFKFYSISHWEHAGSQLTPSILVLVNGLLFLVFILISGFQFGADFLKTWRMAELEKERLQKETARAQLEALKAQLNPHFMFNNLNILTVLIHKNPSTATEFVEQFSEVYRYVLQARTQELVPLSKELTFLEAYCYLLNMRFEAALNIEISIGAEAREKYIPPLSLQLLIENAVRHNVASIKAPLTIWIKEADGSLSITNNLQKRSEKEGAGIGLASIRKRYEALVGIDSVHIREEEDFFSVHLPLLEFAPL